MNCPNCQSEQPEPPPRFCDACGLALPRARRAAAAPAGEPLLVRCPECGVVATSRQCRGCGARVRWPDDVVPPDEQEGGLGKPPAPALELDTGEEVVELVDAPPRDEEH